MTFEIRQSLLITAAFAILFCASTNRSFAQKPTQSSSPDDSWTIRWNASDEFNGEKPDWKKWSKSNGLPDTNSWRWDNESNVTLQNGFARITMRNNTDNQPVKGTYFQSGILKSYRTFKYGYFETRLRGAPFPGSGVCSSFWLYSNFTDDVAEGETIYSEVDVVELQQFDFRDGKQDDARDMDLNLHCATKEAGKRSWRRPKTHPKEQLNKWRAPWDPRDDFHIYGCEVNESEIIWFVDGKEVARKPNDYWHKPKYVTLSLGLRNPFVEFENNRNHALDPTSKQDAHGKLSDFPTSMVVDYVRVWEKSEVAK